MNFTYVFFICRNEIITICKLLLTIIKTNKVIQYGILVNTDLIPVYVVFINNHVFT